MRARKVGQVESHRFVLYLHVDDVDETMRNLGEPRPRTEFVEQPQGACVHRVSPEVTQEVSVFFHHRDFYPGSGQQQAEHHARRSAPAMRQVAASGLEDDAGGIRRSRHNWFWLPGRIVWAR